MVFASVISAAFRGITESGDQELIMLWIIKSRLQMVKLGFEYMSPPHIMLRAYSCGFGIRKNSCEIKICVQSWVRILNVILPLIFRQVTLISR